MPSHARSIARVLIVAFVVMLVGGSLPACSQESGQGNGSSEPAGLADVVATTFYPTRYFAERIAGGRVKVICPLPGDADPIFWRPDDQAMAQYQRARLVITNGAELEKWVATAALPRSRTVESIDQHALERAGGPIVMEGTTHSHGPAGEHTHEGLDGHTWLSPALAIVQARRIAEAMAKAWPQHAEAFEANLQLLIEDLEMLQASLADLTAPLQGRRLLASHPAYNYLAREMGWRIENLDLDPESDQPQAIVQQVRAVLGGDDRGAILLWESPPTEAIERTLRETLGVQSVVFSPAETPPAEGDYMDQMRANFDRLRRAVEGPAGRG